MLPPVRFDPEVLAVNEGEENEEFVVAEVADIGRLVLEPVWTVVTFIVPPDTVAVTGEPARAVANAFATELSVLAEP